MEYVAIFNKEKTAARVVVKDIETESIEHLIDQVREMFLTDHPEFRSKADTWDLSSETKLAFEVEFEDLDEE